MNEKIKEVLNQYPNAVVFEGDSGEIFVVDKPKRPHISRFNKTVMNDPQTASENLLRDCVKFPEKEDLEKWISENPAAVPELAAEINKLAGGGKKFRKKSIPRRS